MIARLKTVALLGLLTGLFLLVGGAVGGEQGATIALVLALGTNFVAYWFSDRIALGVHRARELAPAEAPRLHAMVGELAERAGIPRPRLYLVEDPAPNAFATGRNPAHGAVAVTSGLLEILDPAEVRGVLAHELGHIKNRDTLIATVAASIAGAISYLAQMVFFFGRDEEGGGVGGLGLLIVSPLLAMILQMAISRGREFRADESGARWSGGGAPLARALLKLERASHAVHSTAARPAFSPLYIVHPFHGGAVARLFSTHPSTEERVARLRQMDTEMDTAGA